MSGRVRHLRLSLRRRGGLISRQALQHSDRIAVCLSQTLLSIASRTAIRCCGTRSNDWPRSIPGTKKQHYSPAQRRASTDWKHLCEIAGKPRALPIAKQRKLSFLDRPTLYLQQSLKPNRVMDRVNLAAEIGKLRVDCDLRQVLIALPQRAMQHENWRERIDEQPHTELRQFRECEAHLRDAASRRDHAH